MAADPNAVPISPLNIGYNFQPSQYHPQAVNVPTGAGALWAQVGQTAMNAGQMLQNSALNPEVRAKMQYGIDQYKAAQDQIAYMKSLGPMGHMLTQTGPGGAQIAAPAAIADPTMAARFLEAAKVGPKQGTGGGDGGGPPAVNNPASGAGNQGPELTGQQPQTTTPAPAPKTPSGPPTTKQMGSASTDNDFLLRQMMQERQAAGLGGAQEAAQAGTPPDLTFTNPATGNVQPLQQTAPGMFAGRAAVPPAAAPSAPAPAQPPTDQGSAISQITQQPGVALANWQAQNVHPVIAPKQVLDAIRANVTTQAQDATYMPNGGVNGEPAWTIHMKGGGQSTISASQLAQSSWGKALMANQNVSQMMDAQNRQPQGGQPQQPTPMPSGTGAGAPQGLPAPPAAPGLTPQGPPAAPGPPGGQGMTDIYGNPLGAYTNVQSQGGPSLANLTAGTPPAGQPAQPQAPPSNDTVSQADQNAIQAQVKSMPQPSAKYAGDPIVPGATGPYTYYRNDDPDSPARGRVYTVMPPKAGDYFKQQRWYLGSTGYDTYELPESAMRQYVSDYWTPTGHGPSRDEIAKMSNDELKPWAKQAWYNNNMARSPVDQGTNLTLDASEDFHKTVKQIQDIVQTLGANGKEDLGSTDRLNAQLEGGAESLESRRPYNEQAFTQRAGTRIGAVMGGAAGMDRDTALAIRTLDQQIDHAHQLLDRHPELLLLPGKTEGIETPNVHGQLLNVGTPNIKPSDVLSDVFSGMDMQTKLRNLNALQKIGDARYGSLVNGAQEQWQRIDPKHAANVTRIGEGHALPDDGNLFQNHTMPRSPITTIADANARLATMGDQIEQLRRQLPGSTPAGTPSPTPEKVITDQGGYDALAPGSYYRDQSGGLHQKPQK